jgi:glycosyltransferase involved in cell wall biosynthesis
MQYPKISIVTPSYNQGQYIEETILSIINQNYPNLEYVIIDGGSTDNTIEIIKKYEKHLAYWVSEPDKGQSDAINKGLAKCTGEVFNWLNSDDYLAENSLFLIGEAFLSQDCDVFSGKMRLFSGNTQQQLGVWGPTPTFPSIAKTLGSSLNVQPSTFFRLDKVKSLGGINNQLHYTMDQDLWYRYLLTFGGDKVKKTTEILVNFRIHNDSKTVSQTIKFERDLTSIYIAMARLYNLKSYENLFLNYFKIPNVKNYSLAIENHIASKKEIIRAINYYLLKKGERNMFAKNFKTAFQYLSSINVLYLENYQDIRYWFALLLRSIIEKMKSFFF